jgi:hypothetical protein
MNYSQISLSSFILLKMKTDGGGWTLVAYAESGGFWNFKFNLADSHSSYFAFQRSGSASVEATQIFLDAHEVAYTWHSSKFPNGEITSYESGIKVHILFLTIKQLLTSLSSAHKAHRYL